ncbi:DUF397 domain-containing protein, partial [Streptomyces sp. NPDC056734]
MRSLNKYEGVGEVDIQWQKSSFSTDAAGTNCLELAMQGDEILMRES